ncbi:MAG: OsmC family protein [Pirellulales bacterium]
MAVEIHILYEGSLHCNAVHGPSGTALNTDAPVDNGGRGESFSPTDLVATALGTCVMTVLGLVSARHEVNLNGTRVHVTKEMIQTPVRRIASLKTVVTIPPGLNIPADIREKLEFAAEHCPVKQSIHPDIHAPIEFIYPSV